MIDIISYKLGQKSGGGGSPGGGGGGGGGSNEEWIGDGNTHLWISLTEGRTSPMLGVCPNGTVTVDWGDGTVPDVLTGTSTGTVQWTPNHEYAAAGDYVITLSVDGVAGIIGSYKGTRLLTASSADADNINYVYRNAIQKIEIGSGSTTIGAYAFQNCYSLASIVIPDSVTSIDKQAFSSCYGLASVVIPDSVTSIGNQAFSNCYSLASVVIPDGVTSIGSYAFSSCYGLASVVIPDSVTSIDSYAFSGCFGMKFYDFSTHTAVPTLSATNTFTNIPADCEIRVPAALVDEWKAATNWSTYADYIVGV